MYGYFGWAVVQLCLFGFCWLHATNDDVYYMKLSCAIACFFAEVSRSVVCALLLCMFVGARCSAFWHHIRAVLFVGWIRPFCLSAPCCSRSVPLYLQPCNCHLQLGYCFPCRFTPVHACVCAAIAVWALLCDCSLFSSDPAHQLIISSIIPQHLKQT